MDIDISIEDHASDTLARVLSIIDSADRASMNRIAVGESMIAVQKYFREFDADGGWTTPGPTHGAGRSSTRFGEGITRAWSVGDVDENSATITNGHRLLPFKIKGGTITPKSAKYLTIPIVPEAHGRRVRDYPAKLFPNKKHTALLEDTGDGNIRAVYILRKSVTQKPTPGAMPEDEVFVSPFIESLTDQIEAALES